MNLFAKTILVVGGGSIGKRHIKNLQSLGYKNIFCLKRNKDNLFEQETNTKVITSSQEVTDLAPWATFICNPTALHINSLKQAVGLKSHVFMEKPLTHDFKGLNEAIEALKGHNKVFFIGFMLRFHPLVQQIKSILVEGSLGEVYSARFEFGSFLPYWHPYEDYKISYAARKELGGGVIHTITHELDLIQYFFGSPTTVSAKKMNLGKLAIDVEELFEGNLIYQDKMVTLHLDYLQKDYDRRIHILCDEGKINWNWHDNEIIISKHKEEPKSFSLDDFDVNQLYVDELKAFFKLIATNTTAHTLDCDHAVENTNLTLALHESADLNKEVSIQQKII